MTEPPRPAAASALAMTLICAAQFILQLDFSIVNVALPTIQHDLHMAPADLQWIVTGYALTFGSLLLVGGRLADLAGRRRLLAAGLVLFGVASLGCGLAQWPIMLIGSRVLQGVAGAAVSPAALSLLTTTNPEGPARNRALAIWQATTAAGATTGIVAGGLLTQYLGWRSVVLVNPRLIAVMLAGLRVLPATRPASGQRLDVPGALLVTGSLAALIYGLSSGQQHGFTATATIAALVGALACGLGFVAAQRVSAAPMLPASILADRTRRGALAAMVLIGAVLAGYVYFISLFLQEVLHFSPLQTGLALVPSTATVVLTSTLLTRRLLARLTLKQVLLAGLVAMTIGQLWLTRISGASGYASAVLPGQLLTALGIGLALPTASIAITAGVKHGDQGLAGALFTTSQQAGAAVGLAVLATAAAATTVHASLTAGYRVSFLIATAMAAVAAVLAAPLIRSRDCQQEVTRQRPGGSTASPAPAAEAQLRKA